jgi:Putative adhesin
MKKLAQLYKYGSIMRAAMVLMGIFFYGKTNANNTPKDQFDTQWIEKKKNVTFSYNITSADKISLENQFGDIKVSFWDKNEIKVEVLILANATSDERASNFIHMVDVVGKKVEGEVKIKTIIDREEGNYKNNTWNWKGGSDDKNSLKIDYQVYMPKNNALKIKNSFGNTYLPTFTNILTVHQSYGKLVAEDITNPQSDVRLEFCKNSYIRSISGGKLRASYSGIKMEKADDFDFNNSFGEIDIKEVGKMDAKISYSSGLIGLIRESSNLRLEFSGGFKLGGLGKNVKELDINASYSPVNLTLSDNISYDFEVKANYGDFAYPVNKGVSFTTNSETDSKKNGGQHSFNPTKYYIGKIGKGSTDCKIIVNGNFSSVKFK